MGEAFPGGEKYLKALGRPAWRRSRNQFSRKGDRISQGYGGPRALWRGLPKVRRKGFADPLCRQRNKLLRPMPDQRESSRRSKFVAPPRVGLASYAGGTRSTEATLEPRLMSSRDRLSDWR